MLIFAYHFKNRQKYENELSKNGNQTTGKQKSSNNLQYQNYLTN